MRFLRFLMTISLLAWSLPSLAMLDAALDRNKIMEGETVQLILRHAGNSDADPDLTPLQREFDVIGRSRSSNIRIINGSVSSEIQIRINLAPKHAGQLIIPPLEWGRERTPSLQLTVTAAGTRSGANKAQQSPESRVFLQSEVDSKRPLVQAAVMLTVRLYATQALYQASLELPQSPDALLQRFGQDKEYSEMRNGRRYHVVERRYLIFPQRSGTLSLEGPVLDAQVAVRRRAQLPFKDFFGNHPMGAMTETQPLRLHGDPIVLNVRPRPDSVHESYWLPARALNLTEQWHPVNLQAHVGEPLTRSLSLSAMGITGAQLPDLGALMKLPDGLKAYPDQAKLNTQAQGDNVVGSRQQNIALIADRPGRYTLPALHLRWWDTVANVVRDATLPAHTLEILPADGVVSSKPSTAIEPTRAPSVNEVTNSPQRSSLPSVPKQGVFGFSNTSTLWFWTTMGFAVCWGLTLMLWWRSRGRSRKEVDVSAKPKRVSHSMGGRAAFRKACRENDALAARRHLLAWAYAAWPSDPPKGLDALSQRLHDNRLTMLLQELDRACYANGRWQGEVLEKALHDLPTSKESSNAHKGLADLYS